MDTDRIEQDSGAVPSTRELDFEPNNVESLATVLTQGLRSDDSHLVDRCLNTNNDGVIKSTVARLQAADAGLLLEDCVGKLQMKVNRGSNLTLWIRAVLLRHTAYLMTSSGHQKVLANLQQSIEDRLALQQPLAMLSGRLDLLMAQTLARQEAVDGSNSAAIDKDAEMGELSDSEEDESSSEEEE